MIKRNKNEDVNKAMEISRMFTYSWHIDHTAEMHTCIRVYGLDEENKNVCLRIDDFTPYVYLELPTHIAWNSDYAQMLGERLDDLLGDRKPIEKKLRWMKKLYGAHLHEGKRQLFPYLFCKFAVKDDINYMYSRTSHGLHDIRLGRLKLRMHEQTASPILQFTSCRDLSTAGWIEFGGKRVLDELKLTRCDHEFTVSWKNTRPYVSDKIARPLVMGWDIEANSSNPARMPLSTEPDDKVFQVSCVFSRQGDSQDKWRSYLLTLGNPTQKVVGMNVIIQVYKTEAQLLDGFTRLINTENPNVMVGHNILGFDIPYMVERAQYTSCYLEFAMQGFHKSEHSEYKAVREPGVAKSNQVCQYLNAEGRIYLDTLWLIKRDHNLKNYKLETIANHFLGSDVGKDPLDHHGIFKCYAQGIQKTKKGNFTRRARLAMGIVGKYCVKDSELVVRLFDKILIWNSLTEMAATCNLPIFDLYTEGQQVRVYSQVYKYAMYDGTVVEKDGYIPSPNERYIGAFVFPPEPGCYDKVSPLDFMSLYPCIMISNNIDFTTMATDDPNIPDSDCNVMDWEDHVGCEHDPNVIRKKELTALIEVEQVRMTALRKARDSLKTKDFVLMSDAQMPPKKRSVIIKRRLEAGREEYNVQIRSMLRKIKPYREERKEINARKKDHTMCEKRHYRFLKTEVHKGILPTILENLMNARTNTRKEQKTLIREIDTSDDPERVSYLKDMWNILDKRQLAYKICCNSVYGALGVRGTQFLPLMPAAMCTTYMGRKYIQLAAKTIREKYGGEIVYGDTDSCLVHFPEHHTSQEIWDYSTYVASEVTKLYPPPMKLEFEDNIYWRYLILAKKQYMYTSCDRDGNVDKTVGQKGVVLARRDNSPFVRNIYREAVSMIFDRRERDDILYYIMSEIYKLHGRGIPYKDFIVTQSIKSIGDGSVQPIINEKGKKVGLMGSYKVKLLPIKQSERASALKKKNASTAEEYYRKSLPAVVQLGERLKRRGQCIDAGSRLEYVVLPGVSAKIYDKVECAKYFLKHSNILSLDLMYYLEKLASPLDKVLNCIYRKDPDFQVDFIMNYHKQLKFKNAMIQQLKEYTSPIIDFAK